MMKTIKLQPLCDMGSGKADISEKGVSLRVSGVNGCLKAWLVGEENMDLGNIVDGKLDKEADTRNYDGLLITQSGRQMFFAKLREDAKIPPSPKKADAPKQEAPVKEPPPANSGGFVFDENDGFHWRKITDINFPSENLTVRYILSHRAVYNAFLAHGYYYFGEKEGHIAVAVPCEVKTEPHPLPHLCEYAVYLPPVFIVCADLDGKFFYSYT